MDSASTTSGKTTSAWPWKFSRKRRLLPRLDAEIELGEHRAAELLDGASIGASVEIEGIQAIRARPKPHHDQVEGADLDDVGPAHLDGDDAAVGQARLVHLRHRRRRDRDGRELA